MNIINFQFGIHKLPEIKDFLLENGFKRIGYSKSSPIGYCIILNIKTFWECSAFLNPTIPVIFNLEELKQKYEKETT